MSVNPALLHKEYRLIELEFQLMNMQELVMPKPKLSMNNLKLEKYFRSSIGFIGMKIKDL